MEEMGGLDSSIDKAPELESESPGFSSLLSLEAAPGSFRAFQTMAQTNKREY